MAALLKQVERAKGNEAAPVESVRLGRELCGEVARFLGKAGRVIGVPREAGIDNAALAIALGQALAGLEAFEGEHARLSARHKTICWVFDGKQQPVARLLPRTPPKGAPAWHEEEAKFTKINADKVRNRLIERENYIYLDGYRDAQAGKPPRDPVPNFRSVG